MKKNYIRGGSNRHSGRRHHHDVSRENFVTLMAKFNYEQELLEQQQQQQKQQKEEQEYETTTQENIRFIKHSNLQNNNNEDITQERRMFIASMLASSSTVASSILSPDSALAYEKAYPMNLDFENDDTTINLQSIRQERIAVQKSQARQVKKDLLTQPLLFRTKEDIISSVVWGGALWLLLGSRSNPLVKPIANVLYDEDTQEGAWVKDRNEGLFAPLPTTFMLIMGVIFLFLGFITDRSLLFIAEGDSDIVLQMAGVSLIGGASLELGRIASGEKMITREDLTREIMLKEEFDEFALKRLIVGEGGSVHRSDVIRSFRRYFAKYRVENDEYPLTDLEIERLLRTWNRMNGNDEGISSAGFIKGVKINDQAIIQ